ncbi:MAG TPA: lytic transglycosylase domain-containing protein [Bryobacteraceae bacterium]|nr:lytic transglycosylase domain-containing protein [Bryobacteraceae bacterium]
MLAASPLPAAGPVPALAGGKTLVVRADRRTGRLVRSVSAPRVPKKEIADLVNETARRHDVDPLLVHSVIQVESDYNPNAISPKGAQGLMQLMPSTAKMLGASDSLDAGQNIEAGVKYLKYLQDLYKDDRLALAAYNAGPGAVEKYKNVPPYRETQDYVSQVGKRYAAARKAVATAAPAPEPAHAQIKPEEQHPKLEHFVDENGRLYLRTQ